MNAYQWEDVKRDAQITSNIIRMRVCVFSNGRHAAKDSTLAKELHDQGLHIVSTLTPKGDK